MFRAWLAATIWALYLLLVGVPLLVLGFIHPSRRLVARAANAWAQAMLWACGVKLTIHGHEHLPSEPCFLIGNHQSALDIPVLIRAMQGNVRFLAKRSLFRIPVFGWVLTQYGYVPIDRGMARRTLGTINALLTQLRAQPISFALFPEGTRSTDGRMGPFKQGAMRICQQSGMPLVAFAIRGALQVHTRGRFRVHPGPVELMFFPPLPSQVAAQLSTAELASQMESLVEQQVGDGTSIRDRRAVLVGGPA